MRHKLDKVVESKNIISYEKVVDVFKSGKNLFNEGKMYESYEKWEVIWKYGDPCLRKDIKGFLQLSGGLWNRHLGKMKSVKYLLNKANQNINKSTLFVENINKECIIQQITIELNKNMNIKSSYNINFKI
jgi:hypothetical protein